MNRNYIRIDTLSFSSIEIYMLFFLLLAFGYILFKRKEPLTIKLICMYVLSLPYTDIVYRFKGIQVSEIIILLLFVSDIFSRRIKISKNALSIFMLGFSMILWSSTFISIVQDVYNKGVFGSGLTATYSILNNFKFILIIYIVNRIICEFNSEEKLSLVINTIRFSGNVTAFATLTQVLLYKMGFLVPGIFEMWGIPRAKGLSHEPATNAFVLLITLVMSTIYKDEKGFKVYIKSMLFQGAAFFICFSSGAIPILIVYIFVYVLSSMKKVKLSSQRIIKGLLIFSITICFGIALSKFDVVSEGIDLLTKKVVALGQDYMNGTNISGRGSDRQIIETIGREGLLLGIGSFNSTVFFPKASNTNMYIVLFSELGIVGILFLIFVLGGFLLSYIHELKSIKSSTLYSNIIAFLCVSPLILAWIRVLFFHQIWLVLSVSYILIKLNKRSIALETRNDIKSNVPFVSSVLD